MSLKVGSQKAFFSRVWARLHGLPVPRVPVPREPKKANAKKKKKSEGLFMGPSKNKGKTVNVRHKTSGKELVIQDNPTNIKKYKKLGYTMWVGSRGKYESVSERMIQEHDRQDILKHLIKKGSNPKDAEKLLDKHYDYLEKRYRKASVAKKAEVLVTLGALDAGR